MKWSHFKRFILGKSKARLSKKTEKGQDILWFSQKRGACVSNLLYINIRKISVANLTVNCLMISSSKPENLKCGLIYLTLKSSRNSRGKSLKMTSRGVQPRSGDLPAARPSPDVASTHDSFSCKHKRLAPLKAVCRDFKLG